MLTQAFGLVIRRKRIQLRVSQEELAERAEIHRTYVSSIERGRVRVGLDVAGKVAEGLGVSLSSLIRAAESVRGQTRIKNVPDHKRRHDRTRKPE